MSRTPKTPPALEPVPEPAPKHYRRHDESYKQLFRDPRAAAALICDFAAKGWAHELNMTTLQPFPTETVGPDLKRRAGDCAWHVRFKDGRSVVFLFEFQSSVDRDMALRMLHYTAAALTTLRNSEALLDPDGAVPLVLAFVLHNGPHPWPAATTVAEWADWGELSPAVARAVGSLEVRHAYQLLDLLRAFAQDLLPEDGLMHWLAALERDPWPNLPHVHRAMAQQWAGAECLAARQAFAKWVVERMRAPDVPEEVLSEIGERIEQPTEAEEMGQTYTEWVESHERRGLERGMERGMERGRTESRAMLVRLASRRFGAETAEKLAGLVRAMGAEQLARVGDAVVDCDTGDELLEAASNGASVTANDMGHETGHETAL